MAGIGDYAKKSKGNRGYKMSGPSLLKMVADSKPSPITNEFGIGKGTSPYRQEDEDEEKGGGWKKAAKIGLAALTSGLDAVYGSGKIMPASSARLIKKKKDDKDKKETEENTEAQNILGMNSSTLEE